MSHLAVGDRVAVDFYGDRVRGTIQQIKPGCMRPLYYLTLDGETTSRYCRTETLRPLTLIEAIGDLDDR